MKYLNLFACCTLVKGYSRSLICDLQRNRYYFIPNALLEIINKFEEYSYLELLNSFNESDQLVFISYIEFLEENELIFSTNSKDINNCFPKLSLDWDSPSKITNLIIDIDSNSNYLKTSLIKNLNLEELQVEAIQIRVYNYPKIFKSIKLLYLFFNIFMNSLIKHIEIILPYLNDDSIKYLNFLINKEFRVSRIYLYNSPYNKIIPSKHDPDNTFIYCTKHKPISINNCGIIKPEYFNLNQNHFCESQFNNTCLNRKMSISKDGQIKNCPSLKKEFGNILNSNLIQTLGETDFKELWHVNKDSIKICQDCEFRHICTDCRAYIEDPQDIYSKPLKCGYDPYSATWSEWNTNPLKEKAIKFYGMEELLKK